MKRAFNIFDALFVLALFFKLTGSGPELSWLDVFTPYIIEAVVAIFTVLNAAFGWDISIRQSFIKWVYKKKFEKGIDDAKKQVEKEFPTRGSNPGRFRDPANEGK